MTYASHVRLLYRLSIGFLLVDTKTKTPNQKSKTLLCIMYYMFCHSILLLGLEHPHPNTPPVKSSRGVFQAAGRRTHTGP